MDVGETRKSCSSWFYCSFLKFCYSPTFQYRKHISSMLPNPLDGVSQKKFLSEISGSHIHVTNTGQPNKQNCMKWSKSP